MSELLFLDALDIQEIHDAILESEPGLKGMNSDKLEAVAGRVKNIYSYSDEIDTAFSLAAHYAVAIAKGHAFADGNKRTAFVSLVTVLDINGFPVPEKISETIMNSDSWADIMVKVAEGTINAKLLTSTVALTYMVGAFGVGIAGIAQIMSNK
ncbi:type II toxin-antitoxin system death-on-curing family toxin [Photobacterium chitinilyticum]|uniref:Type II toxin-antitoxin system death-on-curing family toxin n=1 Tax=Photobacterium chitinilyticum TaxID=2485123 RepID=A0A3S3UIT6_9GAMM|nr:type II toxin-antitoxin system death-on-curing family toxin [Photobacterium chitinilyticum]RWX54985.1 type II toxin-antitoxin system death-on-curing family toxin [Photobacterium chitinilyticum]